MPKAFTNYNKVSSYVEQVKLPAGAYPIRIIRAEDSADGKCLCILFDISEGEYKDFYKEKFANEKKAYPDEAKYKGVYKLWYPNGGQYDENAEKRLKTTLETIVKNNNLSVDFTKEWDGNVFKNCKSAMIFQDREWEMNGNTGFTAQPYRIISVENYKNSKYSLPDPKYLNGSAPAQQSQASEGFASLADDEDLPF